MPLEEWDGGARRSRPRADRDRGCGRELLLRRSTDRQREIVWNRVVQGRPSAEVAAMLGTTPGNIDVIVHRALAKMREAVT